jgi:hypothetical protein
LFFGNKPTFSLPLGCAVDAVSIANGIGTGYTKQEKEEARRESNSII